MTTVLLIDDHELIRQGLAGAFAQAEGFDVAGQAGSVEEGSPWRRSSPPTWSSPTSGCLTAPASTSCAPCARRASTSAWSS